jgi:phosphopantothenoylcysteine decarboxylase / phosphopantothenate---cysteine ligase
MARILITSGPTRQYLDPVRYLTNASSGRMGSALAAAALAAGHRVAIVTGPVEVAYPAEAEVFPVVSTEEMLAACRQVFPDCDGLIAAAAPCDYRPQTVACRKIRKTDGPLTLHLLETPDIVASLSEIKTHQWIVAFALETEDSHMRAMQKLEQKSCDLIVVNGPATIHAPTAQVEVLDSSGTIAAAFSGLKEDVSREIISVIENRLIGNAGATGN